MKAAVIARYTAEVVAPYFKKGLVVGNQRPWEPYLTNKMLFHADHKGTFVGEWIATNKGWTVVDPVYFDVMAIFDVTNEYGTFKRYEMMDHDWSMPGNKQGAAGSWAAGDGPGKVILQQERNGPVYYGLYSVDVSGRATDDRVEGGRLSGALSSNAATYIEQAPVYLGFDAQSLGIK